MNTQNPQPQQWVTLSPMDTTTQLGGPSISLEEGLRMLTLWVTSYYARGDTLETLSIRDALIEPGPTVVRMSPEDLALAFHKPPSSATGQTRSSCGALFAAAFSPGFAKAHCSRRITPRPRGPT